MTTPIIIMPYTYNENTGNPVYAKSHYLLSGKTTLCGREFLDHGIDYGVSRVECRRCQKIHEKNDMARRV